MNRTPHPNSKGTFQQPPYDIPAIVNARRPTAPPRGKRGKRNLTRENTRRRALLRRVTRRRALLRRVTRRRALLRRVLTADRNGKQR